jgi:hypothetical protein
MPPVIANAPFLVGAPFRWLEPGPGGLNLVVGTIVLIGAFEARGILLNRVGRRPASSPDQSRPGRILQVSTFVLAVLVATEATGFLRRLIWSTYVAVRG